MKKKKSILVVLLILLGIISTACSPNTEEIVTSINEYRDTLNNLYTELEEKFNENPSKEDWQNFSKDWMPRLTGSKPDQLNEEIPQDYANEVNQLDYAKSQLVYLWNEYNDKVINNELDEEKVKSLKEVISENLK